MGSTPPYITDVLAPALGSALKLNPRGATPPVEAYVDANDYIAISVWNATANTTVAVILRLLLPDGTISNNEWDMIPTADRSLNQVSYGLAEGFILSVCMRVKGQTAAQETFGRLTLLRPATGTLSYPMVLCQGWMNLQEYLTWPPGVVNRMTEGLGVIRSITGTAPGAGAEISETVPAHAVWLLKAFWYKLASAVAVANRISHLIVDDGTNVLLDSPSPTAQAASLTRTYVSGDDAFATAANDNVVWLQLATGLKLPAGYRIRTLTTAIQAADQYTAPQYLVEEWIFQ